MRVLLLHYHQALSAIVNAGVSAALFAPAWTLQALAPQLQQQQQSQPAGMLLGAATLALPPSLQGAEQQERRQQGDQQQTQQPEQPQAQRLPWHVAEALFERASEIFWAPLLRQLQRQVQPQLGHGSSSSGGGSTDGGWRAVTQLPLCTNFSRGSRGGGGDSSGGGGCYIDGLPCGWAGERRDTWHTRSSALAACVRC
jgi:hypothetical protein